MASFCERNAMSLRRMSCYFDAAIVLALLGAALAGCQNSPPPPGHDAAGVAAQSASAVPPTVSIENFTFQPMTLEVSAGTKVKWVNVDDVPHTVRSTDDRFRSGTLDTDDVYERVFSEPGTYEYYCGVHRHMSGTIVVR